VLLDDSFDELLDWSSPLPDVLSVDVLPEDEDDESLDVFEVELSGAEDEFDDVVFPLDVPFVLVFELVLFVLPVVAAPVAPVDAVVVAPVFWVAPLVALAAALVAFVVAFVVVCCVVWELALPVEQGDNACHQA
jgi:hypothetical protein